MLVLDRGLFWCLLFAIAILATLLLFEQYLPGGAPKMSDIASFLVAYSGITFGGCIAGATLAVALPGGRALAMLSINGTDKVPRALDVDAESGRLYAVRAADSRRVEYSEFPSGFTSLYTNLVFIFVYSAFVQLVLTLVSFVATVAYGDTPLYGAKSTLSAAIGFAVLSFLVLYAVQQLMACLNALLNFSGFRDSSLRDAAIDGDTGRFEP